ncbi:MAG: ATP-binding protein, partial [Paraclostridium sp.]|uniref:sensor histidine kinase n=1 Tax=Paraclostridium sp. TaxID=2023273 RepID=UPI003F2D90F2
IQMVSIFNQNNINLNKNHYDYLLKDNYNDIEISKIIDEGGWVEEVKDSKIVNVIGDKKDNIMYYSINSLINKNSNENYESRAYQVKDSTYIVKIPGYDYKISKSSNIVTNVRLYFFANIILIILCMITVFILIYIISIRKLSKPLKILETEINKMSDGYSDIEVNFNSYREFNRIKESFNNTVKKLEKAEEEKIRAEDSKKRIIRDISHDIKTPITSILGYSKAVSEGIVTDEEERKIYLNYIYKKTNRINYLVDELFMFSKLDSPEYKLDLKKCDLSEFLRMIAALYYIDIEEAGFILDVEIPEYGIYSMIDTKEMERAISNLITNALKYNKRGTTLKIILTKQNNYAFICIEDNGIGISENLSTTIFEEFVRVDNSRKTDGGSGLGLTITQKIIKLHDGEIRLYSKENLGTRFNIKLKLI